MYPGADAYRMLVDLKCSRIDLQRWEQELCRIKQELSREVQKIHHAMSICDYCDKVHGVVRFRFRL